MGLAVVYLARKVNPPHFLRAFLASLRRHPAGVPYTLVLLAKGYDPADPGLAALARFTAPDLVAVEVRPVDDALFATAVFRDMGALPHDTLLFHVSWSRVLAPNWGRLMLDALARPGVGVVGASGGWECLNDTTPFPNPSIRTTGFAIRRELWAALDFGDQTVKYAGNLFEAGPNSMTRQIERLGLAPVVVSRDGRAWATPDWPHSLTFRSGDQQGLLIADNRTQDYATARLARRRKLARLNWGRTDIVRPAPFGARLYRRLWWHWV